jgi:hypothetical protein
MEMTITPLEALTEEQVPRPDLTPLEDPMSQRVAQLAEELSDAEAYDAQILAALVSP